ncbi:hypothetical protein G6F46_005705 [Rhizopus delemar]|uniref:Cytochrome P450 n=2 Tax=Rhizopus TaxID=4842 RepID=A0A9P6Z0N1_9FUNG|nr:hypothetical protein G6F55_008917 [Rhizopus delemar]KAG1548531.1 hypothetical protein G6F51_003602 [Rhizopus arrhizus]KAG1521496.1 hypothetical protein G6F52_006694 [Rhizopus delemar]KAG1568047.1 hypothetical protein G6F50_007653 [Rhizopus delemar]KAG1593877.1 hypothetical protein G6F48_001719 [Rhizopus delemar]
MNQSIQSIVDKVVPSLNLIQDKVNEYVEKYLARSPPSQKTVVLGLSSAVSIYCLSKYIIYNLYLHPLRHIPGPPADWIPPFGNFREIVRSESGAPHKRWAEKYGGMVLYHGEWNQPRVIVTDHKLLKQVLTTQEYDFIKTPATAKFLKRFLGNGLLVAEGEVHRFQRKILNPAFSVQSIRSMVPLMAKPGLRLRDLWLETIKSSGKEFTEIEVSSGLSLATLDVIGLAGFGQDLKSLEHAGTEKQSKLSQAYLHIFSNDLSLMRILTLLFPALRFLPTERNRKTRQDLRWLEEESKALVQAGIERAAVEKEDGKPKDLLALMVNLIDDETGKGLTAEELRNQCLTFLAAGHETTSVSLSWCLWLLAQNQKIQDSLRKEVKTLFTSDDIPTYEEINALPLLTNVCRETLRLIPPVPVTSRITRAPVVLGSYALPKGTILFLSLIVNHHSKEIWGEDAEEFNPYRWETEKIGNAYQYLPFLAGGRQCIGYKFALIEMKLLLALLIKDIQYFEKPGFKVIKKQQLTLRPAPNMTLWMKAA